MKKYFITVSFLLFINSCTSAFKSEKFSDHTKKLKENRKVILFVWDGLRPDSITKELTPNLLKFKETGVFFANHHSIFPTITMVNAQALATGCYSGKTGYFGNRIYVPYAKSDSIYDTNGVKVDYTKPVYTQDYKVLMGINRSDLNKPLLEKDTLIETASKNGLKTYVYGKSGAAFLQDYKQTGVVVDSQHVSPQSFAKEIGNNSDNFIQYFLTDLLPKQNFDIVEMWMKDPDSTAHVYGTGSKEYIKSITSEDQIFGNILSKIDEYGLQSKIDVIVVSDHGHSNVSESVYSSPIKNKLDIDMDDVIIANNGGSLYVYLNKNTKLNIEKLLPYFKNKPFETIFVDDKYGKIPGTFSMSYMNLKNINNRNPDMIISMHYNENEVKNNFKGTLASLSDAEQYMSSHGSLSPREVHNTLIARGPSFKDHYTSYIPSSNVDVPATIANIMGFEFSDIDGRPLLEGFKNTKQKDSNYNISTENIVEKDGDKYISTLNETVLDFEGRKYKYFNFAKVL